MLLKLGDRVRTKVQVEVRAPGPGDTVVDYVIKAGSVGQIGTIYSTGQRRISVSFPPSIYPFEGILYDAEELTKLRVTKGS